MAFERVKLFGLIELDVEATAAGTLRLYTNLPGTAMALRATVTVPLTSRRPIRSRLPGTMRGHLLRATLAPGAAGTLRLYGARIWARELPNGQWGWYSLPVVPTPDQFVMMRLPVPPTPEEWSKVSLPVPPTPEEWSRAAIPVPPTPEEWRAMRLPVPPTSEQWTRVELPVTPTPLLPEWAELEMDR